jgi:hemerythrin-like domain-containing protein
MKITDALRGEHSVFYAQFKFIESLLVDANLGAIQALGGMLAAALVPHAMIENDMLFPPIEARIGGGGPTMVMRMEHAEIEGSLRELAELKGTHDELEGALLKLPSAKSTDDARRIVNDILVAAHEHFGKEESVLFPMAEQLLTGDVLESLGAEWAGRQGVALA